MARVRTRPALARLTALLLLGAGVVTGPGATPGAAEDAVLQVIQLSPQDATTRAGRTVEYTVTTADSDGQGSVDLTDQATLQISPDGSCAGRSCIPAQPGVHTVTATVDSMTATTTLTARPSQQVEFFFSRTAMTAADNCRAVNEGVARLDETVAPYLSSLGLAATGSIQTGPTLEDGSWCAHYKETLPTSWSQARDLASRGWTFVAHSKSYPRPETWAAMSPAEKWDETCGAAQEIRRHGLPVADSAYLWPNNKIDTEALTSQVSRCFGTSRYYGSGYSSGADFTTWPYQRSVFGISGGYCAKAGASCTSVPRAVTPYNTPALIIGKIKALQPGQVLALQVYLAVTGTNPDFTTNQSRWDCTAADPALHWTNDAERYCWDDLRTIFNYLAQSGIGISQPAETSRDLGRTGFGADTVIRPTCTRRWASAVDGDWSDADRWSPPGVPTEDDGVCLDAAGPDHTVSLRTSTVVRSLVVGGPGAAPVTLTVASSACTSSDLRFVDGYVRAGGRLLLTSDPDTSTACTAPADVAVTWDGLLSSTGAVEVLPGSAGGRRTLGGPGPTSAPPRSPPRRPAAACSTVAR